MKKSFSLRLLGLLVLTIAFTNCGKDTTQDLKDKEMYDLDHQFTINSAKIQNPVQLGQKIAKDPEWIAYRKYQLKMLSIMVLSNVNLHTLNINDEQLFYKQLGSKASEYQELFKKAKKSGTNIYNKYFASQEACATCNVITKEKQDAYARLLDDLRKNKTPYKKGIVATTSTELTSSQKICTN